VLNGLGAGEFNEFVRNVVKKYPGYVSEMYGRYAMPCVDFVGKQESLQDDLVQVLRMMGVDFDEGFVRGMGRVNESAAPRVPVVWDEHLKVQVERLEYAGIVRYGYEKMF
jgi:hypothetical protein